MCNQFSDSSVACEASCESSEKPLEISQTSNKDDTIFAVSTDKSMCEMISKGTARRVLTTGESSSQATPFQSCDEPDRGLGIKPIKEEEGEQVATSLSEQFSFEDIGVFMQKENLPANCKK